MLTARRTRKSRIGSLSHAVSPAAPFDILRNAAMWLDANACVCEANSRAQEWFSLPNPWVGVRIDSLAEAVQADNICDVRVEVAQRRLLVHLIPMGDGRIFAEAVDHTRESRLLDLLANSERRCEAALITIEELRFVADEAAGWSEIEASSDNARGLERELTESNLSLWTTNQQLETEVRRLTRLRGPAPKNGRKAVGQ